MSNDLDEHERMNYWWRRAKAAEARIEKAEDYVTRHYLDTDMGRDVLAALTEGDEQ